MRTSNGSRVPRRMDNKYVRRRQRGLSVLIASIILIIGVSAYIVFQVTFGSDNGDSSSADDFEGDGNGVVQTVQIAEGASISSLGPDLEERGIVASDSAFQTAAASNPDANTVQPGFYRLEEQMSAKAAVAALLDKDNQVDLLDVHGGATSLDVNVKGGETRPGIFSQISTVSCEEGTCVTVDSLKQTAATVDPAELGAPDWAVEKIRERGDDPKRLDGFIAPGQYVIDPNMDAKAILTDLVTRSTASYNDSGIVERAKAIDLEPYEMLIAASLIEREAPAGDFDKVARVILNRLDEPMRLEFDSTVNYGLDDVELATTDADRERETPWNTYASDGLPATPIAAPSAEAIRAIEHPAEGDWLFFVTIDDQGTTVFNDTFEEHLEDVDRALDSGILDHNE